MRDTPLSAREVAEDLLARTEHCLLNGDFEGFSEYFSVPVEMETFEGKHTLKTIEDLKLTFDGASEFYAFNNVKELFRNCVDARYRDPDTIESTHESRVISHGVLIIPPFPVLSIIRRFEDAWKIVQCSYAVSDADDLNDALMGRSEHASA